MKRTTQMLLLVMFLGGRPTRQIGQDSRPLAITHVNVIDTIGGTLISDMTVVIRGERIVSVDKSGSVAPLGAEIIDGAICS